MSHAKKINGKTIRLQKGDITLLEVDAFVFYASHDLKLGTGFGGAVSVRGGPSIQAELDKAGTLETGQAIASTAGELAAQHIIHAVGPRFQEPQLEQKLADTMYAALRIAEENKMRRVAFPAMGCGFYGVPLDVSAKVMFGAIKDHLSGRNEVEEVIVCVLDERELLPFTRRFEAVG